MSSSASLLIHKSSYALPAKFLKGFSLSSSMLAATALPLAVHLGGSNIPPVVKFSIISSVLAVTFSTTAISAWALRPLINKITYSTIAHQKLTEGAINKNTPITIHMTSYLLRPIQIHTTIQEMTPLKTALHPWANVRIGKVEAFLDPGALKLDTTLEGQLRMQIGKQVFGETFGLKIDNKQKKI